MTHSSTARVPTEKGSRYLQQLAKHWAHKMEVEYTEETARIVMPRGAVIRLAATPDALEVSVEVDSEASLAGVQDAVARHLDRFAFREAPLTFAWRSAGDA